jgi:hypothetical protein
MSYNATYGQRVTESTTITDTITSIIGLSMRIVQDSGAAIADHVAAATGQYHNPEYSKVASTDNSQLPSSKITVST